MSKHVVRLHPDTPGVWRRTGNRVVAHGIPAKTIRRIYRDWRKVPTSPVLARVYIIALVVSRADVVEVVAP